MRDEKDFPPYDVEPYGHAAEHYEFAAPDDPEYAEPADGEEEPEESATQAGLVVISDDLPDRLTVLPVFERAVFPGMGMPLVFQGPQYMAALQAAMQNGEQYLGVALAEEADRDDPFASRLYAVGTVLKVYRIIPRGEEAVLVQAQGLHRFKTVREVATQPALQHEVKYYQDPDRIDDELIRSYAMEVISSLKELARLSPVWKEQLDVIGPQLSLDRPGQLMDIACAMMTVDSLKLQDALESFLLVDRGEKVVLLLKEEIELNKMQQKIRSSVEEKMTKQQREFMLREQLKAIKKELGIEKDDKDAELERIEAALAELELTDEARQVVERELDRLRSLESNAPDYNVTKQYLQVITDLPWGQETEDVRDIHHARKVLDAQHYGLREVKDVILEFISIIIKRGSLTGSNILLVGPPGVGKTSIGKSIAEALGREFYRFSVGGMRDESEIKGHRRTYVGAMPGKLVEALRRTKASNPVVMLDEIDKLGASYQGDPASALLEVLDPEQNANFLDHYLDVRYDLSNVLFIATANALDAIPGPLLDRMEVIRLSGYILEEKVQIAKKYLVPKQREEHGLTAEEVEVTDKALCRLVDGYAREAGVRNLESLIKKIMRKITLRQAETGKAAFRVTERNVSEYLGKPVFKVEELYGKDRPGVVLGLAYTAMGGATLYIEAIGVRNANGGFKQTGQLGEVMRESISIAYSYVYSLLSVEDRHKGFLDSRVVHVHVPAGATPKDGPSAGITMALAMHSLVTGRPVRQGIAMTGEITLTGKVLPIGGVREKVIGARRVGVFEVILPKDNRPDFENLPKEIKDGVTAHFADYFDDVLAVAYG